MKKTTFGSFMISCVWNSDTDCRLTRDKPHYNGKEVCVLQCEIITCGENNIVMLYELIYV